MGLELKSWIGIFFESWITATILGFVLWNASFCVVYMIVAIVSGCVARWPSLSMRRSNGVIFCGLKTNLWKFWGYYLKLTYVFFGNYV